VVVTATAAFVLLVAGVLVYIIHFLLVVFAGVLLAVLLQGLTELLRRHAHIPYALSLTVVLVAFIGLAALASWLVGPRLAEQFGLLAQQIPAALATVKRQLAATSWGASLAQDASHALPRLLLGGTFWGKLTDIFSIVIEAFGSLLIIVFTGVYLAADPALYIDNALRLVPEPSRARSREMVGALGHALRAWLAGRFIAMFSLGILTTVALLVFRVPLALPLGLIAAILFFVPYVGAFISAVPAVLVGLAQSPARALGIAVIYLGVHIVEGYVVTPLIQERAVSMPPALLLTAQILMALLGGAFGVLLATPLVVVSVIVVQMLYVEGTLSEPVTTLGEHGG
jgi:predicted PurR-regulated permease PerM